MTSSRKIKAGETFVLVSLRDKLTRGLVRIEKRFRRFGAMLGITGRRAQAVGRTLVISAVALAAPLAISTKTFADFSDQMAVVRAVSGATADEFDHLNDRAKELGRTTSFTASEVAGAMTELGRAGFDPSQILDAIEPVLSLARATGTELPRAAEIAAGALRGFNLEADQTGRVSDVLADTANKSAQTLDDLGEALKVVAPIAAEANESIEDTAALIGILANNAIKGSLAGTSLARAYKNLSSDKVRSTLKAVGVDAVDAGDNLRPLATILSELGEKTKGFGTAKRLNIFETLFGRGQAAALKLAGSGAQFQSLQQDLRDAGGVAADTAAIMDDTLGGSFRKLLSAVEGVQIAIGEALEGQLRNLADRFITVAGNVAEFIEQNRGMVVAIAQGIVAVGAIGAGLIVAGTAFVATGAVFASVAGIISGVTAAVGALSSVLGFIFTPVGLIAVAFAVLGGVLLQQSGAGAAALDVLRAGFNFLKTDALDAFDGIKNAMAAGDIQLAADILWSFLKLKWTEGTVFLKSQWLDFTTYLGTTFEETRDLLTSIWEGVRDVLVSVWEEVTSTIGRRWAIEIDGILKVWELAKSLLNPKILQRTFINVWFAIRSGWQETVDFMLDAWTIGAAAIKAAFQKVLADVLSEFRVFAAFLDKFYTLGGALGSTFLATLDFELRPVIGELNQQADAAAGKAQEEIGGRAKKRDELEQQRKEALAELDNMDSGKETVADRKQKALNDEIARARAEFDALLKRSRNPDKEPVDAPIPTLQKQVEAGSNSVGDSAAGPLGVSLKSNTALTAGSSAGMAVIANALRGSSGQTAEQQVAENTASIAESSRKIAKNTSKKPKVATPPTG